MEAARRQPHRRGRVGEQLAPRIVGRRDRIEQLAIGLGVGARAVAVVAVRLDLTRGGDPPRDFRASATISSTVRKPRNAESAPTNAETNVSPTARFAPDV